MIFNRVTITGADDSIDPNDLFDLSATFPFVEWGILFSRTKQGERRYPTLEWQTELCRCFTRDGRPAIDLSAHLCGEWARMAMSGDAHWGWSLSRQGLTYRFGRVQFNVSREPNPANVVQSLRLSQGFGIRMILQTSIINRWWVDAYAQHERRGELVLPPLAEALFDESGGKGVTPVHWPTPYPGVACGFAGGITPANVVYEIHRIADVRSRPDFDVDVFGETTFWIDMESGVRDDRGGFDLTRVRDVLEQCAPFIGRDPLGLR